MQSRGHQIHIKWDPELIKVFKKKKNQVRIRFALFCIVRSKTASDQKKILEKSYYNFGNTIIINKFCKAVVACMAQ